MKICVFVLAMLFSGHVSAQVRDQKFTDEQIPGVETMALKLNDLWAEAHNIARVKSASGFLRLNALERPISAYIDIVLTCDEGRRDADAHLVFSDVSSVYMSDELLGNLAQRRLEPVTELPRAFEWMLKHPSAQVELLAQLLPLVAGGCLPRPIPDRGYYLSVSLWIGPGMETHFFAVQNVPARLYEQLK
jgi:hypothetical protein